jgi:hypothetical protein
VQRAPVSAQVQQGNTLGGLGFFGVTTDSGSGVPQVPEQRVAQPLAAAAQTAPLTGCNKHMQLPYRWPLQMEISAQQPTDAEASFALVAQITEQQAALTEQWRKLEAYKQVGTQFLSNRAV